MENLNSPTTPVPTEAPPPTSLIHVDEKIQIIRDHRIMTDVDLAEAYGVETRELNQAAKRNEDRFPEPEFRFQLTEEEAKSSRSQIVILNEGRGSNMKYLPWAYTELGCVMAANVLNSEVAVARSVSVVRAFLRFRDAAKQIQPLDQKAIVAECAYVFAAAIGPRLDQIEHSLDEAATGLRQEIAAARTVAILGNAKVDRAVTIAEGTAVITYQLHRRLLAVKRSQAATRAANTGCTKSQAHGKLTDEIRKALDWPGTLFRIPASKTADVERLIKRMEREVETSPQMNFPTEAPALEPT